MKTVQKQSTATTAAQPKTGRPFFQKSGEEAMAMPEREAFFSAGKNANGNASRPLIQTKLTIGQPGDKYEQEADAVADKVVQRLAQPEAITPNPRAEKPIAPKLQLKAAPAPAASQSSAPPNVQTKCAECEQEEKEQLEGTEALPAVQKKPIFESEANNGALQMKCAACEAEEETLQPKTDGAEAPAASPSLESRLQSSKGGGSHLPENTRSQMEGAIGADFSGVRVHTNSSAVQMNKELGAQAFTHGSDVYFNAGRYDTGSTEGQRLLGHELTHVVQQGGANKSDSFIHHKHKTEDNAVDSQPTSRNKAIATNKTDQIYSSVIQKNDSNKFANETKEQFISRVFTKAITRLTNNIDKLNEWKIYIQDMPAFQIQAQLLSGTAYEYMLKASLMPLGPEVYEDWTGTKNAGKRAFLETNKLAWNAPYNAKVGGYLDFIKSKTHGYYEDHSVAEKFQTFLGERKSDENNSGKYIPADPRFHHYKWLVDKINRVGHMTCETSCHGFMIADRRTIDEFGHPGHAMPEIKSDPFFSSRYASHTNSGFTNNLQSQNLNYISEEEKTALIKFISGLPSHTSDTANNTNQTQIKSNPWIPSMKAPDRVEVPALRSDLCGKLPDEKSENQTIDPSKWGPNSAIVAKAIQQIGTVLEPLGPRGYRVIPYATFDMLYNAEPQGLQMIRMAILHNIDERNAKYRQLTGEIRAGEVPYDELCPIVDELLPTTNAALQKTIHAEILWKRKKEAIIDKILAIVGAALLLLAIIFPPSIMLSGPVLAIGGGAALANFAIGKKNARRGRQIGLGLGAGVYSPQAEAGYEAQEMWGKITMILSVVDLIMIGRASMLTRMASQGGKLVRTGGQLLNRFGEEMMQLSKAGWTVEMIGQDMYRVTRPGLVGEMIVTPTTLRYQVPAGTGMLTHFEVQLGKSGSSGVAGNMPLLPGNTSGTGTSIVPYSPWGQSSAHAFPGNQFWLPGHLRQPYLLGAGNLGAESNAILSKVGSAVHPNVPPFVEGNPCQGIFKFGEFEVPLKSGEVGPGKWLIENLKGGRGSGLTFAWKHVEGHAAGMMHKNSIKEAVLYINLEPCGRGAANCRTVINKLLPKDSKLTVHFLKPDGTVGIGVFESGVPGFRIIKP